jgi:DNA-binding LytR/AlgR family response regulator
MKSFTTLPLISYATRQPRFTLLDSVSNRVTLILFCSVFSFLFMYLFLPFNMNLWYEGIDISLAPIFLCFTGCGVVVLSVTQFLLAKLPFRKKLTNATYLAWFIGEVILVTLLVTIFNVSISPVFFFTLDEYITTLHYTALLLPLPYCIALLWFYTREQVSKLRTLEKGKEDNCLQITDEHDKVVLTVHTSKLLLLKAEDNYVQLFYLVGNSLHKELVRTTLKKMEEKLPAGHFVRAHRSYLINIGKVVLFRKNSKGHQLQLEGLEEITIPVSATFLPAIQQRFTPEG